MGSFQKTVYASTSRTATPTPAILANRRCKGLKLVLDITAGSTLSITPKVEGVDDLTGKVFPLLTGVAQTGVGTTVLTVYPGVTAAANVSASDILPEKVKVTVTHGNGTAATYTVTVHFLF